MVHGKNRNPCWIDRRLNDLAGPEYHAIISFGLPIEPEDSQYGESRSMSTAKGTYFPSLLEPRRRCECPCSPWCTPAEYLEQCHPSLLLSTVSCVLNEYTSLTPLSPGR